MFSRFKVTTQSMPTRRTGRRTARGLALAEFGPSLAIYILVVLVPMIDIGTAFVRYWMAYSVMNTTIHRMSVEDKISDVATKLKTDRSWQKLIDNCGVRVDKAALSLHIVSAGNQDKSIDVPYPAPVPADWLPNGKSGPYIYYLNLTLSTRIQPLFQMNFGGLDIPGLTASVPMRFSASSAWENLARDPDTTQYFLNE